MCGISNSLQLIYSCLVLALVLTVALAQTCERLDPELFPSCVNIGHNQTFKFPSYVDKNRLSAHVKRVIKRRSKCSIAEAASTAIACVFYLPYCVEGRKTSLPPCHRVCAELVLGCSNKEAMSQRLADHYGAYCNLLPKSTAASGECFEPSKFKMTVNENGEFVALFLDVVLQKYST